METRRSTDARFRDSARIRLLIADDYPLLAEAIAAALGADPRIEVVGRAGDGARAVELASALRPDVVLMDLDMPVLDGIEATRRLRATVPDAAVVVLTASSAPADEQRARAAGAVDYVLKGCSARELLEVVVGAAGTADPPPPARGKNASVVLRSAACWA